MIKVVAIDRLVAEDVEVEGYEWGSYRRYASDCWEVLMGMSWESVHDCKDLESAYQAFKTKIVVKPDFANHPCKGCVWAGTSRADGSYGCILKCSLVSEQCDSYSTV